MIIHGHLRKDLHREETAEHLFDCPAIARQRYAIFSGFENNGKFPQEDLISSWYASGVRKRPLWLNCMTISCPIVKEESPPLYVNQSKEGIFRNSQKSSGTNKLPATTKPELLFDCDPSPVTSPDKYTTFARMTSYTWPVAR
ncbi:hypothetical protein J6590_003610 [Homalodisca vitripennis]|nr:hypothetical protein J6590_003610 [Homalodisca vitripennis]